MEYFTSDTHFGHARVIEYDDRPFDNVYHMEAELVRRWNAVVKPSDRVYHLGDVSFYAPEIAKNIVDQLNGYKILIRGNHDGTQGRSSRLGFNEVHKFLLLTRGSLTVFLAHSPWATSGHVQDYSDASVRSSLITPDADVILHGHLHTKGWNVRREGSRVYYNVGTMRHNYTPITLQHLTGTP